MDVRSVHTRDLAASPERVGAILDDLGSDDDRLWPADRWPANMRVGFDRPLGVGAVGGHGSIHYSVEDYEPGRRVVFRFRPEPGFTGMHRFDIEAHRANGSRLTHTLEAQVTGTQRLVWPLVRRFHDAYIEDILDRAELAATGRVAQRAHQPRSLRALNLAQMRLDRWKPAASLVRVASIMAPAALLGAAVIHGAWASGWRWPGGSDAALAERVVGPGAELPSAALTWAVAGALGVAAAAVVRTATTKNQTARAVTWLVAAVLGLRGAAYIPIDLASGFDQIYPRLDLAIYSPLCLALGYTAAVVAQSARPQTTAGGPLRRPAPLAASPTLLRPGRSPSG